MTDPELKIALKLTKDVVREFDVTVSVDNKKSTEATAGEKGGGVISWSLLERCPHFRGWYVQTSMELGPEDVYLLERCPHFRG